MEVSGANDILALGSVDNDNNSSGVVARNSKFDAGAGWYNLGGPGRSEFYNCIFDGGVTSGGQFRGSEFTGIAKFVGCDLSGCDDLLFDIDDFHGARVELWNCKSPASHTLTTGTATHPYTVINYGSEDSTGLTSGGSEQALQIHTHFGTVDIDTGHTRSGGATDLADGAFAYKVVANNVTDNFVGVEVPLADIWVEGDGTEKTYTAFIANSIAEGTDFQDDEVYLRLAFPSEGGFSMYDVRPNSENPGVGGGLTHLLGTPVDLSDDAVSSWDTGANNAQKLTYTIDPDYEGVVYGSLIYSRSGSDTLYVDPLPTIT